MEDLNKNLQKYKDLGGNSHLHSELHSLVDEARMMFGETATKGPGSFGFYLGFFKRLGKDRVYKLLAEIKDGNPTTPGKLFWWKVKEELKNDKEKRGEETE